MSKRVNKEFKDDNEEALKNNNQPSQMTQFKKDKLESEVGTATCFSSDTERKYNTNSKIKNFIGKQFETPTTKFGDLKPRLTWAIVMLVSFITIIIGGPLYCSILVLGLIALIFSELIDLSKYKERNKETKGYHFLAWYYFLLGLYFFNLRVFTSRIHISESSIFIFFIKKHEFLCFLVYCLGLLIFFKSLTKGYISYLFKSFFYFQIITLILTLTSSLIISNIFSAVYWFLISTLTVIANDIFAYISGRVFGRTQLISVSPKKTVEGFVGALVLTLIFAYYFSELFLNNKSFNTFLCEVDSLHFLPFQEMKCDISEYNKVVFVLFNSINVKVIHLDSLCIALFSSLLAPFGGFLASLYKRILKIKDFSDTIPGHGGITDRMDCQILAGIFAYVWISTFDFSDIGKYNKVISILSQMSNEDKSKIFEYLKNVLEA